MIWRAVVHTWTAGKKSGSSVFQTRGSLKFIKKGRKPLRKSARLEEIRGRQEATKFKDKTTGQKRSSITVNSVTQNRQACYLLSFHATRLIYAKDAQKLSTPPQPKNRKRFRDTHESLDQLLSNSLRKRPQSLEGCVVEKVGRVGPIEHWAREGRWPEEYFQESDRTRKDLERDSWCEKYWEEQRNMSHMLAKKKSPSSLRGKRREAGSATPSSTTPSDEKQREVKSAPYRDARYEVLLEANGSFIRESEQGITAASRSLYQKLLETNHSVPEDSLFRDDLFEQVCEMAQDGNEAKVIQDVARLIVPSAQELAVRGARGLKCLIESVNEGWNNAIPVTKPRPQPDYAVGFRREAFADDQLHKIQPFVGGLTDTSYFMGTYYMYFPFLTCEVKCGASALDIADRQNAHSMTLAVRAIVELFRLVEREKEVDREILAFSFSHDNRTLRIYGHYAVIDGPNTTYYRHPIRDYSFIELDDKEKWAAYKSTRIIYDTWMPTHFTRICSVIGSLPHELSFDLSQQSELHFTEGTGLSQDLESHHLAQSNADSGSALVEGNSQSSLLDPQAVTPNTSLTG
ncbi:hypothetical protein LTR66_004545 [Elasticomyces elasticus]|nr:hypothetical protein LTR66_004545 [Elasticomyces elasticus]